MYEAHQGWEADAAAIAASNITCGAERVAAKECQVGNRSSCAGLLIKQFLQSVRDAALGIFIGDNCALGERVLEGLLLRDVWACAPASSSFMKTLKCLKENCMRWCWLWFYLLLSTNGCHVDDPLTACECHKLVELDPVPNDQ